MTLNYILKMNRTQDSICEPKLCSSEMLEFPMWDSAGVSQERPAVGRCRRDLCDALPPMGEGGYHGLTCWWEKTHLNENIFKLSLSAQSTFQNYSEKVGW